MLCSAICALQRTISLCRLLCPSDVRTRIDSAAGEGLVFGRGLQQALRPEQGGSAGPPVYGTVYSYSYCTFSRTLVYRAEYVPYRRIKSGRTGGGGH